MKINNLITGNSGKNQAKLLKRALENKLSLYRFEYYQKINANYKNLK